MELDNIFKVDNTCSPHSGCLLISEPLTDDDYFGRSVVLLTDFSQEKGAVGFVLNKKTRYHVSDFVSDVEGLFSVYQGGPVQPNSLHYLHSHQDLTGSLVVNSDLYWGGDFEVLKSKINLGFVSEDNIRFFIGYSGWASGQLETELKHGFWAICPAKDASIILANKEVDWKKLVKQMGDSLRIWQNVPDDPCLN